MIVLRSHTRRGAVIETASTTLDEPSARLGSRIRQLRQERALTLAQLAELAELSHPFLSQLERGLARPSIGSLDRIVRALGSSRLELFAAIDAPAAPTPSRGADAAASVDSGVSVVRADEGHRGEYGLGDGRLLAGADAHFTPLEYRGTTTDAGEYFRHVEHEFLYVIEGVVVVDIEFHGLETLAAGDSLHLTGGIGHRWSAPASGSDYRLIVVKERTR